jgi:hypothetical protein
MPPILNPSTLYSQEARRDATRIRIYNTVLQQIYTKIKAIARIPGNERSLWYVVPEFIPGTPRFDIKDCIVYLVWNLRNVGYQVDYTHPNLMLISWRNHDEKYKAQESPWAQVLGAAREQVLGSVPTTRPATAPRSTATAAVRPIPAMTMEAPIAVAGRSSMIPEHISAAESEHKRKTILKKTSEYRPFSAQPTVAPQKDAVLTGTLPPKHISFV